MTAALAVFTAAFWPAVFAAALAVAHKAWHRYLDDTMLIVEHVKILSAIRTDVDATTRVFAERFERLEAKAAALENKVNADSSLTAFKAPRRP